MLTNFAPFDKCDMKEIVGYEDLKNEHELVEHEELKNEQESVEHEDLNDDNNWWLWAKDIKNRIML